ncbi:hypothetical protein C4J91_2789 [Pseudomonas sp. R3-52-08]|nr:hypothetical protein C4J91_2789 [Pseudomonas sp. R3-52-08]
MTRKSRRYRALRIFWLDETFHQANKCARKRLRKQMYLD